MKEFGIKLKKLRETKNLTQKELGEILNVRNTTVSAWEKDIAEPPYEVLKQLCLIFEVSADYLLGLEE
ncbi:MAG: helix-turn-helix transcriptional regulator [Clostridia bacterium]|jgi:transcriptional regulator with XRE-family HTH domain|nr:helix-turn-helix transcriptional regulator [Clostridia bacterium]